MDMDRKKQSSLNYKRLVIIMKVSPLKRNGSKNLQAFY